MADHLLDKAILLARYGNKAEAIQLLVHIVRVEPDNDEAWRWLVDLLPEDQSKAVLLALVLNHPDSASVGQIFRTLGFSESAESIATEGGALAEPPEGELAGASSSGDVGPESSERIEAGQPVDESQTTPGTESGQVEQQMIEEPPGDEDALAALFALSAESEPASADADDWEPEWQRIEAPESTEVVDGQAETLGPFDAVVSEVNAEEQEGPPQSGEPEDPFIDAVSEGNLGQATAEERPARRRPNGCVVVALVLLAVGVLAVAALAVLNRSGAVNLAAYIPYLATSTPTWTATQPATATRAASETPLPTNTPEASSTPQPSPTATYTPPPSATPTVYAGQVIGAEIDQMPMVYIPAGTFTMGWRFGEPGETAEHIVSLDAFWIDQNEVTNRQYALCVAAGACTEPGQSRSYDRETYYGNSDFDEFPVVFVNWEQAAAYCTWAGRRLPSEAEWEHAARGDDDRRYPWGNDVPNDTLANFNHLFIDTRPVGSFPEGVSPFGVNDMAGNVAEWVNDWFIEQYYLRSPEQNPPGPSEGQVRTFRGGSFANVGENIRSTRRGHDSPQYNSSSVGFRCAADAP